MHGYHLNFSYKNNNLTQNYTPQRPSGFQAQRPTQPIQAAPQIFNLEKIMENFISSQTQQNKEFMNQNVHINKLITQLGTKVDYVVTHNKMLEIHISQMAQQQAAQTTPGGSFHGQPQPNPKGNANSIALLNGTTYNEHVDPRLKKPGPPKKDVVTRNNQ